MKKKKVSIKELVSLTSVGRGIFNALMKAGIIQPVVSIKEVVKPVAPEGPKDGTLVTPSTCFRGETFDRWVIDFKSNLNGAPMPPVHDLLKTFLEIRHIGEKVGPELAQEIKDEIHEIVDYYWRAGCTSEVDAIGIDPEHFDGQLSMYLGNTTITITNNRNMDFDSIVICPGYKNTEVK